jgi:hypothetical protein
MQQEWKWQTFLSKRKLLPPCYKKSKDGKDHIQNAQKFSELLGNGGIPYNINLKHYTKTCLELRLNSCRSLGLRCPSLFSKCLVLELKSKSPVLTWWRLPSSLLVFLLRFIHPLHASQQNFAISAISKSFGCHFSNGAQARLPRFQPLQQRRPFLVPPLLTRFG